MEPITYSTKEMFEAMQKADAARGIRRERSIALNLLKKGVKYACVLAFESTHGEFKGTRACFVTDSGIVWQDMDNEMFHRLLPKVEQRVIHRVYGKPMLHRAWLKAMDEVTVPCSAKERRKIRKFM